MSGSSSQAIYLVWRSTIRFDQFAGTLDARSACINYAMMLRFCGNICCEASEDRPALTRQGSSGRGSATSDRKTKDEISIATEFHLNRSCRRVAYLWAECACGLLAKPNVPGKAEGVTGIAMVRRWHRQGHVITLERGTTLCAPGMRSDLSQPAQGTDVGRILPREQALSAFISLRRAAYRSAVVGMILFIVLMLPCLAKGQAASQKAPEPPPTSQAAPEEAPSPTGWIGFVQVQSSASTAGTVVIADTDIGYAFTEHISGDIGLPVIFTRSPFSPVTGHNFVWTALFGEPYLDARYTRTYHDLHLTSVLTATFPVTGQNRIYTTGRVGGDWFNHVETDVGGATPYLNFGASNGAVNRFIMPRPYSQARPYETLGFLGDLEGGASYKTHKSFLQGLEGGASAYALVPVGPQKVFSRLVVPYSSLAGTGNHYRYWDATFETNKPIQIAAVQALTGQSGTFDNCSVVNNLLSCAGGLSRIARDNGYSAWVEVSRWQPISVQLGYTHSVHYALDVFTLTLKFDSQSMIRNIMPHH
jgi:hypothetical protein